MPHGLSGRPRIAARELALAALLAGLALLATEAASRALLGMAQPWFLAPMAASAVLLFALPASPLARPWAVIGGNTVAALAGIACVQALGSSGAVAALAVACAIALMFALRCLHPPGGAIAATAVLGGPAIQQLGWGFAFGPVLANSVLLVATAWAAERALRAAGHAAAAPVQDHGTQDPAPGARVGYAREDLDAALAAHGALLDVRREDLEEILVRAHLHAGLRRWGQVRCEDIMSRDLVTAAPSDTLDEAWSRLGRHRLKALPVVQSGRLVGIVTLHDFFLKQGAGLGAHVPVMRAAHRVEEIMTRHVRVARPQQPVVDLAQGFTDGGLHHLPVIDHRDRLVGMVTQSDLVAALLTSEPALSRDGAAAAAKPPARAPARPRAVP